MWSLKLEQEVEKNKALTEALQTLATEHHELKQSLSKSRRSSTLSTLNEDDFYDAVSGQQLWADPKMVNKFINSSPVPVRLKWDYWIQKDMQTLVLFIMLYITFLIDKHAIFHISNILTVQN